MDYIVINGKKYDDITISVSRSFEILYSENTGRTASPGAPMSLDPYGTFYNYKITFARKTGKEQVYDALWEYLSTPRDYGIPLRLVYNQSTISFNAYVSNGSQELASINTKTGLVKWKSFEATFIPMEANRLP